MNYHNYGAASSYRPDRMRMRPGTERSIITSIFNRIALDVAAIDIKHVRLDDDGQYVSDIDSGLNYCLSTEANLDQTGRAFIQDAVMSMLDEGCVALVPIETEHVRIRVYNEMKGRKEDITLPKRMVAIVENPLYAVINEPNSTLQRLIHKLNLLDVIDEQSSSGKMDLIIQLPYTVKSENQKIRAEDRRRSIEQQLVGSKYGIAYVDATERITQLNRPIENNLLSQIEYLTNMLYSQLGITQSILDGTADEKTMLNYFNQAIQPIILALVEEMTRKFLSKTARSQHQAIEFFRDPFRLVPIADIAEIADKFTRNEILYPNELRSIVGRKPSSDPKANELRNRNISEPSDQQIEIVEPPETEEQ